MRHFILAPALALALAFAATHASAQDPATADQIRSALSGNTVMGSMAASGAYTEFYAPDGTIRAADYAGAWSISQDAMCFSYGGAAPTCWRVRLDGDTVTWLADGTVEGTGTILSGNPNGW